ncbi:YopX family protein [Clostridium sp. B9]|uniref:YopX family protein n=1 Tax=Clostridium sp. B9 TaxID=3423224 RepID=UPI003D2EDEEA
MNREIKFRAWDKTTKKIYEVDSLNFRNEDLWLKLDDNKIIGANFFEVELMQYTGLKDIIGKEIYEGDIIPFHFDSNEKGVVKFGEYTDWNCKNETKHIGFYVDFYGTYKNINRKDLGYWIEVSYVVGNIYENPELLGDE